MKRSAAPSQKSAKRVRQTSLSIPVKPSNRVVAPKFVERKQLTFSQSFTTPSTGYDIYAVPGPTPGTASNERIGRAIKQLNFDMAIQIYINSGGTPNAVVRVIYGIWKNPFLTPLDAIYILDGVAGNDGDVLLPYNPDFSDSMVIKGDHLLNLRTPTATGAAGVVAVPANNHAFRWKGTNNRVQNFAGTSATDQSDWQPFVLIMNSGGANINGSFKYTQYYTE